MKKEVKNQCRYSGIIGVYVLLLFILVHSCQKDLGYSLEIGDENNKIQLAKNWYDMNRPENSVMRSDVGDREVQIKPDWSSAFTKENEKYEVVETDLMTLGLVMHILPECMEKFKETNDNKYVRCYSRAVFRTERKTNETVGFIMTQTPDLEWLEKSDFKPFKNSSYLEKDKDYGGWLLFYNLDGSFSNGWVYKKGKIIASIKSMNAIKEPE